MNENELRQWAEEASVLSGVRLIQKGVWDEASYFNFELAVPPDIPEDLPGIEQTTMTASLSASEVASDDALAILKDRWSLAMTCLWEEAMADVRARNMLLLDNVCRTALES